MNINMNQNGEYTKLYYADALRIASKIGSGFNDSIFSTGLTDTIPLSIMKKELGEVTNDTVGVINYSFGQITHLQGDSCKFEEGLYFYHGNHLSSTQFITDINANVKQAVLYTPWGSIISEYRSDWMLDTIPRYLFSGKEKDEESGLYYYEARYYSDEDIVFRGRDPLFEKYPYMSPYAYCANNPIILIDPDGMEWVDPEGNKVKDHSNIKVYIFYNPESFGRQSKQMAKKLEKEYGKGSVAMSSVTTETEFAQDWGDMASSDIKEVNINHHGGPQTINLDWQKGEYITSTGDGKTPGTANTPPVGATDVAALPTPKGNVSNAQLNINSCRSNDAGANLRGSGMTLAQSFRNNTSFQSIRTTNRNVSYFQGLFTPSAPHPQDHSNWQFLRRPTPLRYPGAGLPPR